MSAAPERRAAAQVAFRELHYALEDKKITQAEYDKAMREWQMRYPEFMPGTGCCGNIASRDDA